ncbi:hypothetical protein Tco_1294184 [Tanacetum coccineum]
MTLLRPTPFPATTPRVGVLIPFDIIFDSGDEITTLPVRPASSSDRIPALFSYPLDSGDDSLDEDLIETVESLPAQTASASVIHPLPTRSLPTSHAFARRPRREILMPLGYKATIDRWRAAPLSIWYPLLPSELPSSSSPPSLLPSSSSPSPSLLPSSSQESLISSLPHRFEIRERFAAAAARQSGSVLARGAINRLVVALEETNERVVDLRTRYRQDNHEMYVRIQDVQDDRAVLQARLASLKQEAWIFHTRAVTAEQEATLTMFGERVRALEQHARPPYAGISSGTNQTALDQLVTQRLAGALADMEANRSCTQEETNKTATTTRTCSYKEFHSSMQGNFSGTEGAVGLTRWFKKLKSVFRVRKVEISDRVKYAACTMLDGTLTWWNSYVRSVGINAANATLVSEFKQMLIKKYCPRSEVQKIEAELWNLKKTVDNKMKWEGNHNNNNNNNNYNQNKHQDVARVYTVGQTDKGKYVGNLPHCRNQGSLNRGNNGQGNQDGNKARGNSSIVTDNVNA